MNVLTILSTIVLIILALGIFKRRERAMHYKLMIAAFILDIGMVLYIELTREAVKTATSGPPPLLLFHIIISTLVLVLYFVQFYLGWRLYKGATVSSAAHRYTGITFITLRLTNYITSFIIPTTII